MNFMESMANILNKQNDRIKRRKKDLLGKVVKFYHCKVKTQSINNRTRVKAQQSCDLLLFYGVKVIVKGSIINGRYLKNLLFEKAFLCIYIYKLL